MPHTTGAADSRLIAEATAALRRLALDEHLKERAAEEPALRTVFARLARRYVSGATRADALARARRAVDAGHRVTVDFMGESARDVATADHAAEEFLRLSEDLAGLPGTCGVSLDASHVGSLVDRGLAHRHLDRLAAAAAARGQEVVLSMEGEDRVDGILGLHRELAARHGNVGGAVQARLDRTPADLDGLLDLPGRIRLVKGAYPATGGVERDDPALAARFDSLAARLVDSGHACSVASHDPDRVEAALTHLAGSRSAGDVVVEMLQGIDEALLARTAQRGVATQEYLVYGSEQWLYVCNRIAEDPVPRLLQALVDAVGDRPADAWAAEGHD